MKNTREKKIENITISKDIKRYQKISKDIKIFQRIYLSTL